MIVETQIQAELFCRIMRNRFLSHAICVPELPGQTVIDHLEYGQVTLTQVDHNMPVRLANGNNATVPGHRVRLTQPVTLFIATHEQIVAGGAQGPQSFSQSISVDLFFELTGDLLVDEDSNVTGAAVTLAYAGNNLPPNALPVAVQAAMDEVLQQVEQSTLLDLSPLAEALDTTVVPGNVGIATDPAGTRVAIRLELTPVAGNPILAWTSFYSSVPDRLMGRDWSVLVDAGIIIQTVTGQFAEQLSSSNKFELTSGPTVTWLSWLPGVKIYFEGNITDVCEWVSIGVEVTAYTTFSLEQGTPPQLKTSTHLTWNLIDSDVLLCGLEAALVMGTAGVAIGGAGGPIGAAIGALIGIVVGIVGVSIFAGAADASNLPAIQPMGCEQTSPEDVDYLDIVCHRSLNPINVALMGSLSPDQLAGTSPGLLLLGGAAIPSHKNQFHTQITPLTWSQSLNCNTKGVDVELGGRVENYNSVGIGWQLCDVHVEDDLLADDYPPGFFIPVYTNAGEITLSLNYSAWDAYFPAPYPCHLYVRASCGTRWYDFGALSLPPDLPSKEEVIALWATHCSPDYNDYWGGNHNPDWLIDPDPPWERALHLWNVAATGLQKNDISFLADASGQVLGRGVANDAGRVVHSSMLTPSVSQNGLRLGRHAAGGMSSVTPADGRLLVTQTQIHQQAELMMSGRLRDFAFAGGIWSGLIAVVTSTGLQVYVLPAPNLRGGHLTFQLLDPGLRGVSVLREGLLLAGDGGVVYRPLLSGGRLGSPSMVLAAPARAATALRGIGCVLVERGVQVFDTALRPRVLLPVDSVELLGTLGGYLAVLQGDGRHLTLFDISRECEAVPRSAGTVNLPASVQFRGDALVGSLESPDMITLPNGSQIPIEHDPWLATAWRLPGQYVHIDSERGHVTVFMVRHRRQVWRSPYRAHG